MPAHPQHHNSSGRMIWLHRFTIILASSTLLLLVVGGLVTSTESGLAVPDWPNTYGYFMFSFPLSQMVGGIFYEHGHRLIASMVGFLTIILAGWIWLVDPRRWMRRLGVIALVAIIMQGTLGGITVLYYLPAPISIAHAGLAEIFFCLTVSIALFTSSGWLAGYSDTGRQTSAAHKDLTLSRLAVTTTALIYLQILVGAAMRHTGAGLAIPDFPLAFGQLIPPSWSWKIGVHFTHRIGALFVVFAVLATALHVLVHHRTKKELIQPAGFLILLVIAQFTLGALTVLSGKHVGVNTSHLAVGALLFVTSVVLTLRVNHTRLTMTSTPETAGFAASTTASSHSSLGANP